jgi:hypothetical protein
VQHELPPFAQQLAPCPQQLAVVFPVSQDCVEVCAPPLPAA